MNAHDTLHCGEYYTDIPFSLLALAHVDNNMRQYAFGPYQVNTLAESTYIRLG
jgi:hypothetical protein